MDELGEAIEMATNNNAHSNAIFIVILLLVATVFVLENIKKFKEIFGLKWGCELREENQNKQIIELKNEIDNIHDEVNELKLYSKEAKEKRLQFEECTTRILNDIRNDMIEEKIERIRSSLIEFASCIKLRDYSQESYNHVFDLYSKYIKLIEDNHLKNGYVEVSMEYIKKRYAEQLANGFKDE